MILLQVGEKQIQFEKKDKSKKWFKVTSAVLEYAKKNFKSGDSLKPEFNTETYVIEKLSKQGKEYTKKGGYSGGGYGVSQEKMVERSVYASVANIVSGIEGVTTTNVEKVIVKLYEQGLKLVKGEPVKDTASSEEESTKTTDEEPTDPDNEEPTE